MSEGDNTSFNMQYLDFLRCPLAVQSTEYGKDPGRLRFVKGCWLVCDDNNMKYPIFDGIPFMHVDYGLRCQNIPEESLPVPPPSPDALDEKITP